MAFTIWQARKAGWSVTLRCDRRREGLKSVSPCQGMLKLHLSTLIAVAGAEVAIEDLQKILRCPNCGTDRVVVTFDHPPPPDAGRRDAERPRRRMRPPAAGETTLGNMRQPIVAFVCSKCGRRGEYRREKLIDEFGSGVHLPSLLAIFAHSRGCGLAVPKPSAFDLARASDCLIRYDIG